MTFAMNIKTKYRIPVLLNNKKKLLQGTIKKQLHGTLQALTIIRNNTNIPFTGKNTKNNNHKVTGNNRRNNNQKGGWKNINNRQQCKK